MSNSYSAYPSEDYPRTREHAKTTFRQRLGRWLLKEHDQPSPPVEPGIAQAQYPKFNKSFDGWNIRLHRANGGHIVEAWRNDQDNYVSKRSALTGSSSPEHEMFLVKEEEDLTEVLPKILTQLMLRQ